MTLVADDLRSRPQQMNGPTIPAPRAMPERPRPKAMADFTLAATSTAVNVANLFLDYTLKQWGHPGLIDNGEALLSELVGKAVELTGVPRPVGPLGRSGRPCPCARAVGVAGTRGRRPAGRDVHELGSAEH